MSVSEAPVATVMQLLQMWLQSFQEPILSVPLQQAIAALLYPVNCSLGPEFLGSTAEAAMCIPNQDITVYNAAVQLLTVQQRAVMARLATCVQTIRSGSPESSSLKLHTDTVLQWLTLILTGCSASNRATAAVLYMLERCIDDASVLQLLRSTQLPDPVFASDGQHSTPGVTSTNFDTAKSSVSESQEDTACNLSQTLQGPRKGSSSCHAPHAASVNDNSGANQVKTSSTQTASVVEAGCMHFSSRLAKMIFAKAL